MSQNIPNSGTQGFVQVALLVAVACTALVIFVGSFLDADWFGAGRYQTHALSPGDAMPAPCAVLEQGAHEHRSSAEGRAILRAWSTRELPNWRRHGKVTVPRILIAKLTEGVDIEEANRYLLGARPWSGAGSTWSLHRGDYDFTLVTLTTLLYMFGDDPDRLYPETQEYLLTTLLNKDGGTPLKWVPYTFGRILDTENHHLMTEGSRYLKNQWLATHGDESERNNPDNDNRANGLEAWLIAYLDEMLSEGVYEFNSRPYVGYTLQALLNLEAYPDSAEVRMRARYVLDIMNLQYALGSLSLRRNPPFRRQYVQDRQTAIANDPHTAFMRVWTGAPDTPDAAVSPGPYDSFVLLAELLPYRPPADVAAWTPDKPEHYFVRFGRGASACPEIYSGGPGYLLSAGGAHRGWRSHVVARPITLLLDDGETDVSRCIHIPGSGPWRTWHNTGVYRCFAVANGPVVVPEHMAPAAETDAWRIYKVSEALPLLAAVFSAQRLGIIALFPDATETPEALAQMLQTHNPDAALLSHVFVWPDGRRLGYDPDAPKGVWVMTSDNDDALDRDYDKWPQISGDVPALSFQR